MFFLCVLRIFLWDNSKYLEMTLQYFEEKNIFISKCLFIFLSKYCAQKCLVCINPNAIVCRFPSMLPICGYFIWYENFASD